MKPYVLILFLTMALAARSAAYPIDPRPLRKLIIESEYILIGHVQEVYNQKKKKKDPFSYAVARIEVREVLKGSVKSLTVEVAFEPNMVCPAPARYIPGTEVIVFLDMGDNGMFRTHALSYGARAATLPDVAVFRDRIREMQQILTIIDTDQQFLETTEWLVRCAEHEATRWDGVYELTPESDFMSYYAQSERQPFKYMLTYEQKQRLKDALLATTVAGYSDFGLVDLVYLGNEEVVSRYLLEGLKKLPKDQLWYAGEYMKRLNYARNSQQLDTLITSFEEKQYALDRDDELKTIVQEFIALVDH
jgi:hypothetical protein